MKLRSRHLTEGLRSALIVFCAAVLVACAAGDGSTTGFGAGSYTSASEVESTSGADDPENPAPDSSASQGSGPGTTTSGSTSTTASEATTADGSSSGGPPPCTDGCVEECFDGHDNDGDGDLDCADSECSNIAVCNCTVVMDAGFGTHAFCPMLSTWDTAQTLCQAAGMHLVSVDSEAHNSWIVQQSQPIDTRSWWIGYTDAAAEGTWQWTDGSPSVYENWFPGEPSDGVDPENCAAVPEHSPTTWNDLECDVVRPFVCEQ